ncbi:MAG: sigma-70 family RNA polymerase sigma factor [Gammaproteobacteria bacterium]|jgi:RNA polymerase sigma-70 factor (ECF subfamily)
MTKHEELKHFFSQCVEETMGSLYGTARRLTQNNTDAEDLVAECVAKAWSAIANLQDKTRSRPWIFRILHNCFISHYRKKSVRPMETVYYEDAPEDGEQEVVSVLLQQPDEFLNWWGNPEREYVNRLLGENIMAAIRNLPEVFRESVLLINLEGFSYDEAAEILGVPPGTVRSRMKRGRTLLQRALWDQAHVAGIVSGDTIEERQA